MNGGVFYIRSGETFVGPNSAVRGSTSRLLSDFGEIFNYQHNAFAKDGTLRMLSEVCRSWNRIFTSSTASGIEQFKLDTEAGHLDIRLNDRVKGRYSPCQLGEAESEVLMTLVSLISLQLRNCVVLIDEPGSHMDTDIRRRFLREIRDLSVKLNIQLMISDRSTLSAYRVLSESNRATESMSEYSRNHLSGGDRANNCKLLELERVGGQLRALESSLDFLSDKRCEAIRFFRGVENSSLKSVKQ